MWKRAKSSGRCAGLTSSEDDAKWPKKNAVGRQELEIRLGNEHISFETAKIGSLVEVQESDDPEGQRVMYYLVQDLKVGRRPLPDLDIQPDGTPLQDQADQRMTGARVLGKVVYVRIFCNHSWIFARISESRISRYSWVSARHVPRRRP